MTGVYINAGCDVRERIRLALALFRTSWIRSISTIAGIAAITAMASSVLLVLNAFDKGVQEQLDAVFHERNRIISTRTGTAITPQQLRAILDIEGLEKVLPAAQLEGSIDGERAVVLILPDAQHSTDTSGEKDQAWLSTPLRETIRQAVGATAQVRLGPVALDVVVGPDPTAQGYPQFDQSAYAIMTASTLEKFGHPELAAPTVVLASAPTVASQEALDRYVAGEPSLEVQDRAAADTALRIGIQPILQNLPLVALVAFLLGLVLVFTIIRAGADAERVSLVLLRALGASSRRLRGLATVSGVVHGLIGCALGLALAAPAASSLMASIPASSRNSAAPVPAIPMSPPVYAGAAAAVLLVCVVAARSGVRPLVRLSAEDQFRGMSQPVSPWRTWTLGLVGFVAVAAAILLTLNDPGRFGSAGLILLLTGWATLGSVLIGALLSWFDRLALRTRPGFVSRSSDYRVAQQMRSGGMVVSGALVLLVSLSGLATNLQKSTEPTLAGMGDIDLMVQDVALDDLPTVRNISPDAEKSLAAVDGVATVRPVQMGYITYQDTRVLVQGVAPDSKLPVVQQGTALGGELTPGKLYVSTQFALRHAVEVGDEVAITTPAGETLQLVVSAVVDSFLWPGGLVVSHVEDTRRLWPGQGASAYEVMTERPWQSVREEILNRRPALHLPASTLVASGPDQAAQAEKIVRDSSQLYQALALIGLFVAMLIASSAIALDTSTRLREFGVIRAIGGRSRFLTRMVVTRATLLVAPATVVGGLFGILLLWLTTETSGKAQGVNLSMHWSGTTVAGTLLACGLVIGVAAIGSARLVTKRSAPDMLGAAQ